MKGTNKFFNQIKSKHILWKIFNSIKQNKLYKIIQYNKRLQNKLGLSINDFKRYTQIEIEVEIIPEKKYNLGNFDSYFINPNVFVEPYYHIFFNGNYKEDKNRPFITLFEKITKIKIIIDHEIKSLENLFYKCKNIKKINFKKFNRKDIINMAGMFRKCHSLKELNLSNFNTEKVSNMSYMFYECKSLKELNLLNFNTKNVKYMNNMFDGCESLKNLNLSNFTTDKVVSMVDMFERCFLLNITQFPGYSNKRPTDKNINYSNLKCNIPRFLKNEYIKNEIYRKLSLLNKKKITSHKSTDKMGGSSNLPVINPDFFKNKDIKIKRNIRIYSSINKKNFINFVVNKTFIAFIFIILVISYILNINFNFKN